MIARVTPYPRFRRAHLNLDSVKPLNFFLIVVVLVLLQFAAIYLYRWADARNAITIAIRKRMLLWTVAIVSSSWIILYEFPAASRLSEYIKALILYFFAPLGLVHAVFWTIEEFQDSQWYHDNFRQGEGASARWAGESVFRANEMPNSWREYESVSHPEPRIFLGRSKKRFDSRPRNVGVLSDTHMVTFGMPGAGKSVFVLYNNCSIWPGSMLVLDPKGELARNTISARTNHHSRCRILDPYGVEELRGHHDALKCGFNPLAEIDLKEPGAAGIINGIAEGCVIPSSDSSHSYWTEGSQLILAGTIAHGVSALPKNQQNLPYIADLLTVGSKADLGSLLQDMSHNDSLGGLPQKAANVILRAGDKERGSLLNELQRSLRWISDPPMRASLERSDFSMRELWDGEGASIYVVLPFDQTKPSSQIRWMRVLMRLGLSSVQRAKVRPDPPVLFVLDEFPALGKFDSIKKDFRELRGAGIKMWLLAQDAVGLQDLYGHTWNGFTGSSTTQVIGINCDVTARWVSERLGHFMKKEPGGRATSRPLMETAEVLEFLGKSAGNQIIIPVDGAPWQLDSVNWHASRHAYRKP